MPENAHLEFFEFHDTGLLAQYFELRQRVYRRHYPSLPADFGHEEEIDGLSHILLTCQDGRVGGGARLTISKPDRPRRLPLEEGGYNLKQALPDYHLDRCGYAEISRLAVDPAWTEGTMMSQTLGHHLCQVAARNGVEFVFSICPKAAARMNRINSARCGIEFRMIEELETPFGIRMWLCAYLTTGAVR